MNTLWVFSFYYRNWFKSLSRPNMNWRYGSGFPTCNIWPILIWNGDGYNFLIMCQVEPLFVYVNILQYDNRSDIKYYFFFIYRINWLCINRPDRVLKSLFSIKWSDSIYPFKFNFNFIRLFLNKFWSSQSERYYWLYCCSQPCSKVFGSTICN